MESIESAARDYQETLAELKCNNKTQINLLTILADDFKQAAPQIVDVIEKHLNTCSPPQKLPVMYVCDSILKNVRQPHEYDALFARKIISMFEHVFRQGDEKTRGALYKLRVTWASSGLFMPSKLYALDMKINKLDGAWPISNPHTGRALRDDPQVTVPAKSPTTSNSGAAAAASTSSGRVFVNPKFIEGKNSEKTKTTAPPPVKEKAIKKEVKDPLDKLLPSSSKGPSATSKPQSPAGSKRKSVPPEHPSAPIRKKVQSKDEDLRAIAPKKVNAPVPPPVTQPPIKDQDFRPKTLKPTSVIGSHAFAPPPPPVNQSVAPPRPLPPSASAPIIPPFIQPPPQIAQVPQYSQRHSPPQDPAPPVPSNSYSSEQTKLDVPANNRIFVDGKAYEVMFVDDTAVIERGGAPHRIYFAGPPRNLIIDEKPYLLHFDTPTKIDIFGSKHIVKFGAPSRELYIGGHPFKGQFGGPPIVATINGRRHEIRLTGSAPEVKIEPEPAYHLTHFLHKMREEKKIEIASEKPEKKEDWLTYLKNLKTSGILPPLRNSSSSPRHQTPPPGPPAMINGGRNRPNQRWGPPPPPPQSSSSAPIGGGIERRHQPPAAIADFNIRLLQIRYDVVVEALTTKRTDSCKFCGMRLDDSQGKSKEWQDHMDWHVKQNLSKHGSNSSSGAIPFRQWYPMTSTWLTPKASEKPSDSEAEKVEEVVPGVASSGVNTKECSVCGETFEEYYDDDEETWRLRDTVSVHGKIVHSACSADATRSLDTSSFLVDPDHIKKEESLDEKDIKMLISSADTFQQQYSFSRN